MSLISASGNKLIEDKSPKFIVEIAATCPRDDTRISARAEASGLAPISLPQFLEQAFTPTLQGFQQRVIAHEQLHTAIPQGIVSKEGQA